VIDQLHINEGSSEGAKRGWDKRGRGRKQEPSVAERFASKTEDSDSIPKLKDPKTPGTSRDGSKKLEKAFTTGSVNQNKPTKEEMDAAEAKVETAKAKYDASAKAWKEKGRPSIGVEVDVYDFASGALKAARSDLSELQRRQSGLPVLLTASEAKDISVKGTVAHLPPDADLSALKDYNTSSRYRGDGTSSAALTTRSEVEKGFVYNVVDTAIQQWSNTSADTSVRSLEMQMAVAREFKLGKEEMDRVAVRLEAAFIKGSEHEEDLQFEDSDTRISALQVVARAMYNNTQAKLKELGVEEVVVYRGSSRPDAEAVTFPHLGDRSSGYDKSKLVDMKGNAAASWSLDLDIAAGFTGEDAGNGKVSCIFKTVVPRAAIFSTTITGMGCLSEREVIVLGVGGKAQAWRND
jgi:hypothetical protein